MGETDNGIEYSKEYTQGGVLYIKLYPITGVHTYGDRDQAILYLKGIFTDKPLRVMTTFIMPEPGKDYTPELTNHTPGASTDKYCTLCEQWKTEQDSTCDQPKNGYCLLFRRQAEYDATQFGMKPPRNQEEKT